MTIVERISEIYDEITLDSPCKLHGQERWDYFERLLMNGNIITYSVDGELQGFLEFWRLSYDQWGRICANLTLTHEEDLLEGPVCLITRMWIKPDLRNGETFIFLGRAFLERNKDTVHFAAMQEHKRHKPLQIYSREQVLKHYKI
jgi:hypothetical protein